MRRLGYPAAVRSCPVVLSTWPGMSPSCRSPVVDVPEGSNIRIDPPGEDGLCSSTLTGRRAPVRSASGVLAVVEEVKLAELVPVHVAGAGHRHDAIGGRTQRGRPEPLLQHRPL